MFRHRLFDRRSASLGFALAGALAPFVLSSSLSAQSAPQNLRLVSGTGASTVPTGISILPGQNIQSIVDGQPAGTTFVLKAGVHRMQTITPRTGDVFVGETSNGAKLTILSGARVLTGWAFDGARWYVSGQTQQGQVPTTSAEACRPTHPRCAMPEDLFFDNVQKFHESSLVAVGAGEWFFDYASDRIYVGDNPTGHVVETSVTPTLFNPSFADNVTLRDVIVEKYASPTATAAINLGYSPNGAENWVVSNSEVRWNHGAGIGLDTRTSAKNNYVHHNCGFGFIGAGVGVLVESNEIAYNNVMAGPSTATCGYNSFWGAGGSKFVWTTNMIVRGNFSHHNDGPGLWTDINNIYTLYENNTVEDNVRGGIFHEISYDATIRNNVARRNGTGKDYPWWTTGAGIEIVSSRNVEVYGNILEDNWQGITGLNDHRGSGNQGAWTLINLQVHDNQIISRISDGGGGRTGLVDSVNSDVYLAGSNNHFLRNSYILGSTPNYFMWLNAERNENEWQNYGQDTTGTFTR